MIFDNTYTEKEKKKNGIYYTPDDIALFMANEAKNIDDKKGVWLDPCCGLGILSLSLASIQDDPIEFVKNRLVINEKDPKQLKLALQNFKEKFGVVPKSFNEDFLEFEFDVDYIIMNPPYFKYKKSDIYAYFINKATSTTKGFVSINPLSYTNATKFKDLRKNILKFDSVCLYHFDNIPGRIFEDAMVRVSIIVADNMKPQHKTTGVIRWKTSMRKEMILNIKNELHDANFSEQIFYKTNRNTTKYISKDKTLKNYTVGESEYPLYVTNSPRYFITASSRRLDRNGQIEIFMKDEESYKRALVLLNSSYLYWWWRISDSSLSLTKKTLLSLPWIEIETNDELLERIFESENNNIVFKKNAGKLQENIRHPRNLMVELNSTFLDENFIDVHN
jgi:predicted RNA methylase